MTEKNKSVYVYFLRRDCHEARKTENFNNVERK
jgi:hypothetical protein